MKEMKLIPIGKITNREGCVRIELKPEYAGGLEGLDGYGHVQVLWWADRCDNEADRSRLAVEKPYRKGPEVMGIFATRSPARVNPVAVSNAGVAYIDAAKGIVGLHYIDAADGTPVVDLKPYVPSLDRVEHPETPDWCRHWPGSCEESGSFDWAAEFNF